MAQANARNYALGVEGVSYEGPLRIRLPVKKKLDDEGSFSFEIPLPNPDRQVLLKRFAGGFKQALSSPLTVHQIQSEIAAYMPDTKPAKAGQPWLIFGMHSTPDMHIWSVVETQITLSVCESHDHPTEAPVHLIGLCKSSQQDCEHC